VRRIGGYRHAIDLTGQPATALINVRKDETRQKSIDDLP
jgi:hypothetical protein